MFLIPLLSLIFFILVRRKSDEGGVSRCTFRRAARYTLYATLCMLIIKYYDCTDCALEIPKSQFYELSSTSYPNQSV